MRPGVIASPLPGVGSAHSGLGGRTVDCRIGELDGAQVHLERFLVGVAVLETRAGCEVDAIRLMPHARQPDCGPPRPTWHPAALSASHQ